MESLPLSIKDNSDRSQGESSFIIIITVYLKSLSTQTALHIGEESSPAITSFPRVAHLEKTFTGRVLSHLNQETHSTFSH